MRSKPSSVIVYAGKAADHNARARPAAIRLGHEFSRRLGTVPTIIGEAFTPTNAGWRAELDDARADFTGLQELAHEAFAEPAAPVLVLTRNAAALVTIPSVLKQHPDAVVLWFGAHPSLNTPRGTRTGDLGGMALSATLGWWDSGFGAGLAPGNLILCDARDIDPNEAASIAENTITHLPASPDLARRLTDAIGDRPVFVHFSCDTLRPGTVPTDYRPPGGLALDTAHTVFAALSRNKLRGVEIAELEADPGDGSTVPAALIADLTSTLLRRF